MLLAGTVDIPVGASLLLIVAIVLVALVASWAFPRHATAQARP
jgi:FlaG/FlaF family flagellin (archaellin)